MALFDIFFNIFDGYGVGGIGPFIFMIIPIFYSAFQSFRTLLRSLRLRKDISDVVVMIPPFVIFFMAAFIEFFLNLMIFNSFKSPFELVTYAEATYGHSLHLEVLLLSLILLILSLVHTWVARSYSKRITSNSFIKDLFKNSFVDIAIIILLSITAVLSIVSGCFPFQFFPELLYGAYLYFAYTMVIKSILLLFSLVWTFFCGKKESEDIGFGITPLERLLSKIRKSNAKKAGISLFSGIFLCGAMMPAVLGETKVNMISDEKELNIDYVYEFAGFDTTNVKLINSDFNMGDVYAGNGNLISKGVVVSLWFATIDTYGVYVISDYGNDNILNENTNKLIGTLKSLPYHMKEKMEIDSSFVPNIPVTPYYLDGREQPDYSLYKWVVFVAAVPLLYMLAFLIPALFPKTSKDVRSLYKEYPDIDEIMLSIENSEHYFNSFYFYKDFVVITDLYIVFEDIFMMNIVDIKSITQYKVFEDTLEMDITDKQMKTKRYEFPSQEVFETAEKVLYSSFFNKTTFKKL